MFYLRFSLDQFIGKEGAKIGAVVWIVLGIFYVFGLAALVHGYFSYRDPLMRQRVRILTFGTLVAVIPFLIFKIGMEELAPRTGLTRLGVVALGGHSHFLRVLRGPLPGPADRSSAQAQSGLRAAVGYYLGPLPRRRLVAGGQGPGLVPADSPLVAAGATLAVAAALWPARAGLQRSLDHRFYHSRENMAAVIEEFSKEIPRLIQRDALLQKVGSRLCEVLSLPGMAVYLTEGESVAATFSLCGLVQHPRAVLLEAGRGDDPGDQVTAGALRRRPADYPENLVLAALFRSLETAGEPFWVDPNPQDQFLGRETITREQAELKARTAEQRFLGQKGIQLLIPMVTQSRLVGLLTMPLRPGQDYEVHELQLLTIVAGQVALQVENSRLYEEEVAKQKLEEEMAMARQIQARLLPGVIPDIVGVDIGAINISSKQVSGDYYDLIERPDGRLAMVIADVSGKGMPASILASNLQAALRAQCDTCSSPGLVLERINRQIHASTDPQHFATLFLAVFDPLQRTLVYSSGGHNPPVLIRAQGACEMLDKGGMPLGAFDFGTYEEGEIQLEEGDLLFLYTDGLTETKGPDGEEDFGEDRLEKLLRSRLDVDVTDLIDEIKEGLREFSGRREHDDDITMIAMKVTAAGQAVLARAQEQ